MVSDGEAEGPILGFLGVIDADAGSGGDLLGRGAGCAFGQVGRRGEVLEADCVVGAVYLERLALYAWAAVVLAGF